MPYKDPAVAKAYFRAKYLENREAALARAKAQRAANPEKADARVRAWVEQHPERRRQIVRASERRNPETRHKNWVRRRAAKQQAVPAWYGELDDLVFQEAAHLTRLRKAATHTAWHIDHVVPLRGETVTGLHVWNNVQVIPAIENLRKGNRLHF